jgi:hypothetical protein
VLAPRRYPHRPPIVRLCACGRPGPYVDAVLGRTRHLCRRCWREWWLHEAFPWAIEEAQ